MSFPEVCAQILHKFIQTDVINEDIISVFLLSDGMEKINFECINNSDIRQEINANMIDTILSEMNNTTSANIKQELETNAINNAETGSFSIGQSSDSNLNLDEINKLRIVNKL